MLHFLSLDNVRIKSFSLSLEKNLIKYIAVALFLLTRPRRELERVTALRGGKCVCYEIVQSLSYNGLYFLRYQVPTDGCSGIVLCYPEPASMVPSKFKTLENSISYE